VDRSVVAPFSIDGDPGPRRAFTILSGSTGSSLENIIFEEIWGTDSISTIKIIQLANQSAIPVFKIDQSNRSTLVPQLTHPWYVIDWVNAELDQGRTVTIPRDPMTRYDWTGTGWISMDMATGAASYMISGGLMGGSFTQYQQYVEDLVRNGDITREQGDELIRQARERIHLPVSDPVTSQFGERTHPVTGRQSFHEGVDFGSPAGTDVAAPADGTVARSYNSSSYGQTVIVNHGTDADGNTVYSVSAHNQTRLVNAGDTVTAGQQIADSGSTGISTGPHVHYEIRVVPSGGPTPDQGAFFDQQYAVNPTDYMWPTLTPP
jgi:biotin carboxyl carrier protein